MSRRAWFGLGIGWVLSLAAIGILVHAQDRRAGQAPVPSWPATPFVVTGNDIGFRVAGFRDGGPNTPIGNWVIRGGADSPWVEVYMSDPKIVGVR
jgi:hypothetical protein